MGVEVLEPQVCACMFASRDLSSAQQTYMIATLSVKVI